MQLMHGDAGRTLNAPSRRLSFSSLRFTLFGIALVSLDDHPSFLPPLFILFIFLYRYLSHQPLVLLTLCVLFVHFIVS